MSHSEVFRRIESAAGPALIAFVIDDDHATEPMPAVESDWHRHLRGQFFYVEKGLLSLRTCDGAWTLPPHRVGWLPPGVLHTVRIAETTRGWGVFVAPEAATGLPGTTCVLGANDLMRALVHRASTWSMRDDLDAEQERVLSVLMDEIRRAPQEPLHLNMPSDRRLLRIAHAVLERPDDGRTLEDWAGWAGLSPRTVTRLFRYETGSSFAQWRQQARLSRALERLAGGEAVASVADALGYASVSAFVAMFRRSFGQSPGRYFAKPAMMA
ncbi:AraC family transcriptional regulator [Dyella subtropica]|uniref:AraC family transcriptional regulator n=1 Tax=Dyella subtropica TaxID=2992127 RepID=UPI002252356B|nr:helix-turn-helix transcriptional regulator [Dyella subtropica]